MSLPCNIPLIDRAANHLDRVAIKDASGEHTYRQLLDASARVAGALLDGKKDLDTARVAFLVPPGFEYVATQWGIWRAGAIAVPMCALHPPAELDYVLEDSGAVAVVAHPKFEDVLAPLAEARGVRMLGTADALAAAPAAELPKVDPKRGAMILYTSGTTSRPKGVLTTHHTISAQVQSLVQAWEWSQDDRILHMLPLHHIHGIINVLCCAMWSGACCDFMPKFDPAAAWQRIVDRNLTLFMAVPTIYAKLTNYWEAASEEERAKMTEACKELRLMVSGSAALPVTILEKWRTISGHTLLERYGMTEIGMGLSNSYRDERIPGAVGRPLPGVSVRLVDEDNKPVEEGAPGEIQIKGDTVFSEYWQREDATREAFVDGWFKTGDVATCVDGVYRILGRNSVDIIKTGGYKVSALEIEEVLRTHPAIDQCAVVGVEDPEWGERVSAAVVLRQGETLDLDTLRNWAKEHLAVYKVPTQLLVLDALPLNAMGKVVKPEVAKLVQQSAEVKA